MILITSKKRKRNTPKQQRQINRELHNQGSKTLRSIKKYCNNKIKRINKLIILNEKGKRNHPKWLSNMLQTDKEYHTQLKNKINQILNNEKIKIY